MSVARPLWLQSLTDYTADEFREVLSGMVANAGVIRGGCFVQPNSPVGMSVIVNTGLAVVPAKSAANGHYLARVTANEVVTIGASAANPRWDIIVLEVDDTAFGDASSITRLRDIQGTASGSPVLPALTSNQLPLAYVYVGALVATITAGNITDTRTATDIPTYADPTALAAALPNPPLGQMVFLTNPGSCQVYRGATLGWGAAGITRIASTSFATNLASLAGGGEVVGYSQAVPLIANRRYRVSVKATTNGDVGRGVIRVRYSTGTVTTGSAKAGDDCVTNHSKPGTPGRVTAQFSVEFLAPTTATYNIAIGVAQLDVVAGETIVGDAGGAPCVVTIDDCGP